MPQTLLLADDSVTIQRVIELTFADEAIKVVAVSDGDQAIERIEADPPDIVLVDIGMPGRTGYEVAHHIKQSPRLKHIPVLLLTGAFEPVDQAKATAAGCDGVLAKPFEPQLVIARVKELLDRGGNGTATASTAAASLNPLSVLSAPAAPASPGPFDAWTAPHAETTEVASPADQAARLDDYFDQLDAAFQTLGGNAPAATEPPKGPTGVSPVADIIDWFGRPKASSGPVPDLPLATEAASAQVHEPEPEPASEFQPESEFTAVPEYQRVPDFEPERGLEPEHRLEPQRDFEPERELEPERAFESEPEHESEAEREPEREPEPVRELEPDREREPEREPEPAREPDPERAPEREPQYDNRRSQFAAVPAAGLPPIADAFTALLAAEQHEPIPAFSWPMLAPPSSSAATLSEDALEDITRRVLDRLSDRVVREAVADAISGIAERLVREEIERIKASIK